MNNNKPQFNFKQQKQPKPVYNAEIVSSSSNKNNTNTNTNANIDTNTTTNEDDQLKQQAATKLVDVPFGDEKFMDLQKDITKQMVDIGGDEFQKKLMKLNEIPAVQTFQKKALKGEKPTYDDYMALMKDHKFQKYNAVMSDIAKNPKFHKVTAKFASMDWHGAYQELQKDPEALSLYMKAFDELE